MTSRQSPLAFFRQTLKSDALVADEIINIFLLRPLAAALVWLLYPTRITPNQVTVAAIVFGLAAGAAYAAGTPAATVAAGLLITAKDIADDADGQLARAKEMYSRRGRFLDSIGDFAVDLVVFAAITITVYHTYPSSSTIFLGVAAFLGITLRVSYHVFYQASFLHLEDRYKMNRITEEITDADRLGDPVALRLQVIFNVLYTWQDLLMCSIDRWCAGKGILKDKAGTWYGDRIGLRLSGLMGFGTEFALLTICSVTNHLYLYLVLNVVGMNGVWCLSILYRKLMLSHRLEQLSS